MRINSRASARPLGTIFDVERVFEKERAPQFHVGPRQPEESITGGADRQLFLAFPINHESSLFILQLINSNFLNSTYQVLLQNKKEAKG